MTQNVPSTALQHTFFWLIEKLEPTIGDKNKQITIPPHSGCFYSYAETTRTDGIQWLVDGDQSLEGDLIWTGNEVQINFWPFVTSCIRTPTLIFGYELWIGRATFNVCLAPAAAGQTRPQLPHASLGFRGNGIFTMPMTPAN